MTIKPCLWALVRRAVDAIAFRYLLARRYWSWKYSPRRERRQQARREAWARRNRFMYIGPVPEQRAKVTDGDSLSISRNILSRR